MVVRATKTVDSAVAFKNTTTEVAAQVRALSKLRCGTGTILNATKCGILIEGTHFIRNSSGQRQFSDEAAMRVYLHRKTYGTYTRSAQKAGGVGGR